jgi:hypothetical protein
MNHRVAELHPPLDIEDQRNHFLLQKADKVPHLEADQVSFKLFHKGDKEFHVIVGAEKPIPSPDDLPKVDPFPAVLVGHLVATQPVVELGKV